MTQYNPLHRRSIRLKGYDYSQAGFYFITICTQNRLPLFGNIENGETALNDAGRMVENEWLAIPNRFKQIQLHKYVVMPNHFHAIMEIVGAQTVDTQMIDAPNTANVQNTMDTNNTGITDIARETQKGQPQEIVPTRLKTVGDMVGAFQSITTVEYIRNVKQHAWAPFPGKLWQRNYYACPERSRGEHIIRDEQSYIKISEYIINNPLHWQKDNYYGR